MTMERRVANLEESLSPTGLVLRWMAEAQTYGDVPSYVTALLAQEPPVAPLDRLAREAVHGVRASMRGKRPEVVEAAVRTALRETVFRFELVMRINVTAHELLGREALIDAALSAHVALVTREEKPEQKDLDWLGQLRDLIAFRVGELRAMQEARRIVEQRYLEGHAALFPDVAAAWKEQIASTETIADMAVRLAELDGLSPSPARDPEPVAARTDELVSDLVEPARSDALDKLGEGRQSLAVAEAWLRAKAIGSVDGRG